MPVLSTLGAAIANVYGFTSGLIKDQYFNLVSLLLPGNGTDGKQNRTFLDSSGQNGGAGWTITPNGNATQGTFSPFSQTGWGAYFDGSNDNVSFASGSQIIPATGDFTIEAWVYPTSVAAGVYNVIYAQTNGGASAGRTSFQTDGSNIAFQCAGTYLTSSSGTLIANRWNYVAATRTGSSVSLYVNGSATTGLTASGSIDSGTSLTAIGANWSPQYMAGYISNFRVSTTIRSNLTTVPTSPFTNDASTRVLTLQNNRFIDNSSSPFTLTANNGAAITPFAPFAPTQSYSASAVGGSGYFDGTGDYLSIASNAAFQFGAGNFTLEAWVYLASYNGSLSNMIVKKYTAAFPTCEFLFQIGSTGQLSLAVDDASNETFITTATSVVPVGAWAHCVATRSGSALRLFVNGKLVKYGTTALTIVSTSTPVEIGNNIIGNIGGLRIFKGSIPTDYQTSSTTEGTQIFTPPTAPLTTTSQGGSSPSLLLNFTNAGVIDATAKNVLETVGTAQISSTTSKFPPTSIYLSGDGNYLTSRSSPVFSLNGDFTMEAWVYPINAGRSADAEKYGTIVSCSAPGVNSPEFSWFVRIVSSSITEYFLNINGTTVLQVTGLSVSLNAWHYFAVTRSGTGTGNVKLYVDGNLVGTSSGASTQSPTFSSSQTLMVGRNANSSTYQNWLSGYFQGVRITPGYVRTVTTIPTAPFPVQ